MRRYIDADAFAEKMKRQYCENCDNYQGIRCRSCSCGDWLDDLYFEPTADVRENVKGKWIERKPVHLGKVIKGLGSIFVCSVCGEEVDCKPYNYCPNCGAQMRIEKQIIHDAIDNTPMAEDVFVGIKEKLHKAVDEFNREEEA